MVCLLSLYGIEGSGRCSTEFPTRFGFGAYRGHNTLWLQNMVDNYGYSDGRRRTKIQFSPPNPNPVSMIRSLEPRLVSYRPVSSVHKFANTASHILKQPLDSK